jgi:hypothetical protein
MPKAYPVYDRDYQKNLGVVRAWLQGLSNLQLVGRNGQHRYNNQDHSMVTAIYAARNVAGAEYDVWDVNVEQEYHEESTEHSLQGTAADRLVPRRVEENAAAQWIRKAFAQYDPVALGTALAIPAGLGLFAATAILLLKGGPSPGAHLSLVANYLVGYKISWSGALIGMLEAGLLGFAYGWCMASLINAMIRRQKRLLFRRLKRRLALEALGEIQRE